jgi:hypothetical protein
MSCQVNFYMTPEDEITFFEFLINDLNCTILNQRSQKKIFTPIKTRDLLETPRMYWALVIVNPKIKLKAHHITSSRGNIFDEKTLKFRKIKKPIYFIDKLRAPVVELLRCQFNERHILIRGRIWASYKYFGDRGIVSKGEDFQRFYKKIERWIKKHCNKQTLDYFGPEALRYFKNGGKIQGLNRS